MALFRCSISKQRALLSRRSSVAVYLVHSHLQNTSASASYADEKVRERLNVLANSLAKQNELNFAAIKQLSPQFSHLHSDNHHSNGVKKLHVNKPQLRTEKAFLESVSNVEPLISPTQLAFMSLRCDENWCKTLTTVHNNAMKSRELLGAHRRAVKRDGKLNNECLPAEYAARLNHDISIGRPRESSTSDVAMFSNYCKDVEKEKEKKRNADNNCDPLLLAIVYQALRDELPIFFQKGHGYDLYHKRVTFINGLTNTTFSGLRTYKCVMTSMRLAAHLCMTDIKMHILKITKDSKECNIKVRWRVSGTPRYAAFVGKQKDGSNNRYVDGFSIFEVDTSGLICCHRLLKLMPSQSPQPVNPLWALNTAAMIALLRQQRSFEMLARHRVEDIEDTCLPF